MTGRLALRRDAIQPSFVTLHKASALLATTALAALMASGAVAQTHTVVQNGEVSGTVLLDTNGDSLLVENGGAVSTAPNAVAVDGTAGNVGVDVTNHGLIESTGNAALYLFHDGDLDSLNNTQTAVIQGLSGIYVNDVSTVGNVINAGSINGIAGSGFYVSGGAIIDLNNLATGQIAGTQSGILGLNDTTLTNVTNAGTILGVFDNGIDLDNGGITNLDNLSGGTIRGATNGIVIANGDFVDSGNFGEISGDDGFGGGDYGILLSNGDLRRFTNHDGGVISGGVGGIMLGNGHFEFVDNGGRITGGTGSGIEVMSGLIYDFDNLGTGVIIGGADGINTGNTVDVVGMSNAGTIAGITGAGISLSNGTLENFRNMAGGHVGGLTYGILVDNNGMISDLWNAGMIVGGESAVQVRTAGSFDGLTNMAGGLIHGGQFGVSAGTANLTNGMNAGTISAESSGAIGGAALFTENTLDGFTNTGLIENVGTGIQVNGVSGGIITDFVNSGTINAASTGGASHAVLANGQLASLTNSGRIFSDLTGFALLERLTGGTDLTLLPGSVIQGRIDIEGDGAGANNLFVGKGLNLATTFESGLPDMIETHGALLETDAGAGLVAVADPSALAAQDNALSNLTSAISGIWRGALDEPDAGTGPKIWAEGFGTVAQTRGTGASADVDHRFGGVVFGAQSLFGDTQLGFFGGLSANAIEVAVGNGQTIDTAGYFAGAYGRYDTGGFQIDFGLTGGMGTNSSERLVANNLVLGGLETAAGSFDSYFVAPEVTIGTELQASGRMFKPSASLRYGFVHAGGYTESGTVAPLTVSDRSSHVLDARLQIAMPVVLEFSDTQVEVRTGIDGRMHVGGGSFDVTLLGNTTPGFDPGGASSSIGGFAGASVSRTLNETTRFFFSAEIGMGSETAFRANADAGIKVEF